MRNVLVSGSVVFGLVVSLACGGGGGSPSSPDLVQVSGTWQGEWVLNNGTLTLPTTLNLRQTGATVGGSVTFVNGTAFTFDISGRVEGSFLMWDLPGSGCTEFLGRGFDAMGSAEPMMLDGTIVLDQRECGSQRFAGPASFQKTSSDPGL